MKILTAGDKKYRRLVLQSIRKIESFGYEYIVYDLGKLGFGQKFEVDPVDFERQDGGKRALPALYKATMVADCLTQEHFGETILYLDADAFLVGSVDELESKDFDIAVTVRRKKEIERYGNVESMGWLNSGVVVYRKTRETMDFVEEWIEESKTAFSDQSALNTLLTSVIDLNKLGSVVMRGKLAVKLLTTDKYNNYYFDGKGTPKIRHLKGGYKKRFVL